MAKRDLNVFLIKEDFRDFESVIEEDAIAQAYKLKEYWDLEGVIFMGSNPSNIPKWLAWLQEGAEDNIDEVFNASTRAVLLIRRQGRVFAFTFGHGRHMLVSEAIVRDFGVRVVLNGVEPDGLSSADTMAIGDITLHQRTQTSRQSSLSAFNIDVESVLLRNLTGKPKNEDFGAMLTGRQSIQFSSEIEFSDIGKICDTLFSMYVSKDYKEHFWWFDHFQDVSDPELLDKLNHRLFDILCTGYRNEFYLAPPQIIEYENIDGFSFTEKGVIHEEISVEAYLEYFNSRNRELESIKKHYVFARNDEQVVYKWRLYDCIVLEVLEGDDMFILSGGAWFRVQRDFASLVNTYVEQIPDADLDLPACYRGENEQGYNLRAAEELRCLCLDRQLVTLAGSKVEVCDLLTNKNQLIHVKPWRSSSTLSHLFSQGRVSAESLLQDQGFREETMRLIERIEPGFPSSIAIDKLDPVDFEVVYAVIYSGERPMHQRLPFFSKLNMMNAVKGIRNLGFKVSKARVLIVEDIPKAV